MGRSGEIQIGIFLLSIKNKTKQKNSKKKEVSSTSRTLLLLLSLLSDIGACWRAHTHTQAALTLGLRKASLELK